MATLSSEVTVVISIRVDSGDRTHNLGLVLELLQRDFPSLRILVIEQALEPQLRSFVEKRCPGSYRFRHSRGCFHKARAFNEGAALSKTDYILFYDSDVYVVPEALEQALNRLRRNEADFIFPYNGVMLQVRASYRTEFLERLQSGQKLPVCGLEEPPAEAEHFEYLYGEKNFPCTGGALLARRETFFDIGGYNENILSYSCEDVEFSCRAERLRSGRVQYVHGANIFHFEHRRGPDSRYNGFHSQNLSEWKRVEAMPLEELRFYSHNRFHHFAGDTSKTLRTTNSKDEYRLQMIAPEQIEFPEVTIIWNLSERNGKSFDRFLRQASQSLSDYLVIIVEVGQYKHSRRRHSDNVLYLQLPPTAAAGWLNRICDSTERPHLLLCGPNFALDVATLLDARRRVVEMPHQAVAMAEGLYFHRDLTKLTGFPEEVERPSVLAMGLLEMGIQVSGKIRVPKEKPDFKKLYHQAVAKGESYLRRANRRLVECIPKREDRAASEPTLSSVPVSLVVTTYGNQTRLTQACLEKIFEWKKPYHEVIVVVHDETPMFRAYLESLKRQGAIDQLLLAVNKHGHLAGVNLGFAKARNPFIFNLCIDVFLGPKTLDRCAAILRNDPEVGLIGWHYDWAPEHEGTIWREDGSLQYTVRKMDSWMKREGQVNPEELIAICSSPWYTGKTLAAAGTDRILCVNGSFFGTRKVYWDQVGGFDDIRFQHYWADDHLCYALLDQGLDILNLPKDIRCSQKPEQFYSRSDWKWIGKKETLEHKDELLAVERPKYSGLDYREIDFLNCLFRERKVALVGQFPEDWVKNWQKAEMSLVSVDENQESVDCILVSGDAEVEASYRLLDVPGVLVGYNTTVTLENSAKCIGSFRVWRKEEPRHDKRRNSQLSLGLKAASS